MLREIKGMGSFSFCTSTGKRRGKRHEHVGQSKSRCCPIQQDHTAKPFQLQNSNTHKNRKIVQTVGPKSFFRRKVNATPSTCCVGRGLLGRAEGKKYGHVGQSGQKIWPRANVEAGVRRRGWDGKHYRMKEFCGWYGFHLLLSMSRCHPIQRDHIAKLLHPHDSDTHRNRKNRNHF